MTDNIFDTSRKLGQSKKNKTSLESEKLPVNKNPPTRNDYEIEEMLEKMRFMKKDLENQLSAVYQKGKESKINIALLVDNKDHLTEKELEKLQEEEKSLTEKISAVISPESCLKKIPKNKEKMTQERKGKLRGARNNWIPIR